MNKKHHSYLLVLSIAVAGAAWIVPSLYADSGVDSPGEHAREAVDTAQNAADSAIKGAVDHTRNNTNAAVDAKTAMDVHARLASIINNAVARNGFDDLIGSLDKPARDRIGLERFKDFDKLNASIDQFRQNFHDRYNTDFDFKTALLDNAPVYRGPDKDHATVALTTFEKDAAAAADAIASGSNTMPMELNLIIDGVVGDGWRLQAPATLSARQLSEALSAELGTLSASKDKWPADISQAYLTVAKHVFRTIESTQPASVTVENR